MKLLLTILACLVAASAGAQTIKSLGVNTTNGQIVLTNANTVFPINNSLSFVQPEDTAAVLTFTDGSDVVLREINWNNPGVRSALGLGIDDNVEFGEVRFGYGILQDFGLRAIAGQISGYSTITNNAYTNLIIDLGSGSAGEAITAHRQIAFNNTTNAATTRTNLGLGATWLTNTDVTNFRTDIGLGATNNVTFSNITATGTLGVSNTATFATNVTVNGNLSVGSLTTTTPSTWALDATQTAAATNGVLALPSNANVIRLTNNNAISGVSGGVLGAFYYLVNQATNAVTISNVGGITVDGAQNLTLSPNESATLVATGATNASVAARGDLNNVTLTGVDNLATQQTASSASSLMTRGLSDVRYLGEMWNAAQMVPYNTTNIPLSVFRLAPMVTYTNGQAQGPFMEEFVSAQKYAGKTVRVLAYCRADSTNGGNVQGTFNIKYLTNTAGGPDPNFALTAGGQSHGTLGVYTNAGTDVFPVATSTNQYLIFTSNVGTIPTNAQMIIVSGGFNRASTNTTYTNNLYMHAVQLVVENP